MPKTRTREHIIADLSVHHFEGFVLRCGHTAQRVHFDYGYDLWMQTFDKVGNLEPGYILVQLKASDNLRWLSDRSHLAVTVRRVDVETWLQETSEVFLVVYDAANNQAYWFEFRPETVGNGLLRSAEQTVTLRVPAGNILGESTIQMMCERKWSRIRATTKKD